MKYEEQNINSVGELISQLKQHISDYKGPLWFRGQSKKHWKLEPKFFRLDEKPTESHLINRFKQNASYILNRLPQSDFGWLFLMQHHSVPTRLLDWTESPLVSLYFSARSNHDKDGSIWVLLPTVLNKKSNYRPEFENEVPSFQDEHLTNYSPATIEKEQRSKLLPMAAIAPRNSPRMQAQLGVFTISHRENIPIECVGEDASRNDHIWRYILPKESKASVLEELHLLGYNKFHLFPELENINEHIPNLSGSSA